MTAGTDPVSEHIVQDGNSHPSIWQISGGEGRNDAGERVVRL